MASRATKKDILVPGYRLPGTSVCLYVCLLVYLCVPQGARVYFRCQNSDFWGTPGTSKIELKHSKQCVFLTCQHLGARVPKWSILGVSGKQGKTNQWGRRASRATKKDILVPGYRLPGTSVCLYVCLQVYLCVPQGARVYFRCQNSDFLVPPGTCKIELKHSKQYVFLTCQHLGARMQATFLHYEHNVNWYQDGVPK